MHEENLYRQVLLHLYAKWSKKSVRQKNNQCRAVYILKTCVPAQCNSATYIYNDGPQYAVNETATLGKGLFGARPP